MASKKHYRTVYFCGNFKDAFDQVSMVDSELNIGEYNCNFRGERVRIEVWPITCFTSQDLLNNINYHFYVVDESSRRAKNMAAKIQRASSKRFIQQAEAYLAERKKARQPTQQA